MIEWGTLAVAVIALIQPWALALWRRLFRRPLVIAHRTSTIEVGFSSLGPTLGLLGTLEGRHRDAFVRSMDVRLTRLKDQAQHRFNWGVFRSFAFGGGTQASYELCSGFLLRVEQPFRYNIQFWERPSQEAARQHLQRLREGWQEFFLDSGGREVLGQDPPDQARIDLLQKRAVELYSNFAKQPVSVEAYTALHREAYWEPGRYRIELLVTTLRPEQTNSFRWEFELTDRDIEHLRLNVVKILQDACGQYYGQYNFVYVEYMNEGNAHGT